MGSALPEGFTLRSAAASDAASIAALITAVDAAFGQGPWATEVDISDDFKDPDLDRTWAVEREGELVAYGELWRSRREDADAIEAQAWVHPSMWGRGLGSFLVESLETEALAAGERLGRRPLVMRTFFSSEDEGARALFARRGYELTRHFFHMTIDLDGPHGPPAAPPGITIRELDPDADARSLYELMQHAFAEHWSWVPMTFETFWEHVAGRDDFDPSLTLLALESDRMLGASINIMRVDEGWVNDLGVRKEARGRGIGELLLRHSFALFSKRGVKQVSLGVDARNATGAVHLYERVGMRATRTFDTYEKQLLA